MKICVAGAPGAFGTKHLDAIAAIEGIEVSHRLSDIRRRRPAQWRRSAESHTGLPIWPRA